MIFMTHPRWCNTKMYIDGHNHTQHTCCLWLWTSTSLSDCAGSCSSGGCIWDWYFLRTSRAIKQVLVPYNPPPFFPSSFPTSSHTSFKIQEQDCISDTQTTLQIQSNRTQLKKWLTIQRDELICSCSSYTTYIERRVHFHTIPSSLAETFFFKCET